MDTDGKAKAEPLLTQDMVAGFQKGKCGLKYVMFIQSRKATKLFAFRPSVVSG